MITVSTVELFLKAAEILSDGYDKVEITELEGDEEESNSLSFEVFEEDDFCSIDYETIDDINSSDSSTLTISADAPAPYPITLNELALVSQAFHNAVEYCLTCLKDKTISADTRSDIASSIKEFESYIQKLDSFLNQYLKKIS